MSSEEEICNELDNHIKKITDTSKFIRKNGLNEYHDLINQFIKGKTPNKFPYSSRFSKDIITLTNIFSDESEMNRLKVIEIVTEYLLIEALDESKIVYLTTAVHSRICNDSEESEDVRVNLVLILKLMINQFGTKMAAYVEDISAVLVELLNDKSPEILISNCNCLTALCEALQMKVQEKGNLFIKPLSKVTFHQRFKVRISAIQALGCIGIFGESNQISNITGCLTQHSNEMAQVRVTLVQVAGKLAMCMPDRYSYWHYILPCLLLWIRDTDNNTREAAIRQFTLVGEKYIEENREQLQEQLNYDFKPKRYPILDEGVPRFNLGCRLLGHNIFHKVLPGISGDLKDWKSESRLASSKLLTILVLLGELQLQQYGQQLLTLLNEAFKDSEPKVVHEATTCAEYLGYFLLPATSVPCCLKILQSSATNMSHNRSVKLLQLTCVGLTTEMLSPHITPILDALLELNQLISTDVLMQNDVLKLGESLLMKCRIDYFEVQDDGMQQLLDVSAHLDESILKKDYSTSETTNSAHESDVYDYLETADKRTETSRSNTDNNSATLREGSLPSQKMLRLLLLIIGSGECSQSCVRARELMLVLAGNAGVGSVNGLLALHSGSLLGNFISDAELWSMQDPEFMTASAFLLLAADCVPAKHLSSVSELYRVSLGTAGQDRMVHARLLSILNDMLSTPTNCISGSGDMESFLAQIITDWLGDLITGRCSSGEAEVLRSGAVELLSRGCQAAAPASSVTVTVSTETAVTSLTRAATSLSEPATLLTETSTSLAEASASITDATTSLTESATSLAETAATSLPEAATSLAEASASLTETATSLTEASASLTETATSLTETATSLTEASLTEASVLPLSSASAVTVAAATSVTTLSSITATVSSTTASSPAAPAVISGKMELSHALATVVGSIVKLLADYLPETRLGSLVVLRYVAAQHTHLLLAHPHNTLMPQALTGIVERLDDRNSSVRYAAAEMLGMIIVNLHRYCNRELRAQQQPQDQQEQERKTEDQQQQQQKETLDGQQQDQKQKLQNQGQQQQKTTSQEQQEQKPQGQQQQEQKPEEKKPQNQQQQDQNQQQQMQKPQDQQQQEQNPHDQQQKPQDQQQQEQKPQDQQQQEQKPQDQQQQEQKPQDQQQQEQKPQDQQQQEQKPQDQQQQEQKPQDQQQQEQKPQDQQQESQNQQQREENNSRQEQLEKVSMNYQTCLEAMEGCVARLLPRVLLFLWDPDQRQQDLVYDSCTEVVKEYGASVMLEELQKMPNLNGSSRAVQLMSYLRQLHSACTTTS